MSQLKKSQEAERRRMGQGLIPQMRRLYQGWELAEKQTYAAYNSSV